MGGHTRYAGMHADRSLQEYGIELPEKATVVSGILMKTVDAATSRASVLRQTDADLGKVVENRLLTSPNAPAKRHIGECLSLAVDMS